MVARCCFSDEIIVAMCESQVGLPFNEQCCGWMVRGSTKLGLITLATTLMSDRKLIEYGDGVIG